MTPISALGIFELPSMKSPIRCGFGPERRQITGFTLIEMLAVLLVMGLCTGLVAVISWPDDRSVLREEAVRLSGLLDLAATEAQLSGQAIAWTSNGSGYRFWRLGDNSLWAEIRNIDTLRARTLPPSIAIALMRIDNMAPQRAMRLEFAPYGSAPAFTIAMSLAAERYTVAGTPIGNVRAIREDGSGNGNIPQR